MSLLPGLKRLIVNGKWLIVLFLFTIFNLLFTNSALAQPAPPNPQPCKNPIERDDNLTDNYVTDARGDAPIKFVNYDNTVNPPPIPVTGAPGDEVPVSKSFSFTVDFSNLQALFSTTNSNYLEGSFQSEDHRFANILDLSSQDFNLYHGPGQKASPKILVDEYKRKYVEYVYNKPELAESGNKYTDINGQNPKTIYELVNTSSFSYPPGPPSWGGNPQVWNDTWGRYWEKIPTAYTEFYVGKLEFKAAVGKEIIEKFEKGRICIRSLPRTIQFILPQFFRTVSVSDQLNQLTVPYAAQSFRDHGTITELADSGNILAKAISLCKKLLTETPKDIVESLSKIIKISINLLNPFKPAFAIDLPDPAGCLKRQNPAKEGSEKYCALPPGQLQAGESCNNKIDANKLDQDNPNVICTFNITWSDTIQIPQNPNDPNDPQTKMFYSCTDNGNGTFTCQLPLKIWPVFRIPWLAEIWNSTTYSDQTETGTQALQQTGRPGVYANFIPKAVGDLFLPPSFASLSEKCQYENDQSACDITSKLVNDCAKGSAEFVTLCIADLKSKSLPGKETASADNSLKKRFSGGWDCSKEITRDRSLKPKAIQLDIDCQPTP